MKAPLAGATLAVKSDSKDRLTGMRPLEAMRKLTANLFAALLVASPLDEF